MDASIDAPVAPRPLDLGGIISETFRIYRDNYLAFVVIAAVFQVPSALITAVIKPDLDQLWLYTPLSSLVTSLLGLLGTAATIHAAGRGYVGVQVEVRAAYKQAIDRFWSMLGAGFLMGAGIILLSITVIGIPFAIYLAVRWSLSVCAVVLEGESATFALSRSTKLVKGSWWRVLGITIVLGLIVVGIFILGAISIGIFGAFLVAIQWITGAAASNAAAFASLASTLLDILVGAFSTIGLTVLFFDLRNRKEVLDAPVEPTVSTDLPWRDELT